MPMKTYKILYHLRADKRVKYKFNIKGYNAEDALERFKAKYNGKYVITSVRLVT